MALLCVDLWLLCDWLPHSGYAYRQTTPSTMMWDMKTWKQCTRTTHFLLMRLFRCSVSIIYYNIIMMLSVCVCACSKQSMCRIRIFTISFQFITHDMTHWTEKYLIWRTENIPYRIASHRSMGLIKCRNNRPTRKWNSSQLTDDGATILTRQ